MPNQFAIQDAADLIGAMAVIFVFGYVGWKWFESYCERQPIMEPYEPENQDRIAAEHVVKMEHKRAFDELAPYLRRELKDYKNPTRPGNDPVEVPIGLHYGEGQPCATVEAPAQSVLVP